MMQTQALDTMGRDGPTSSDARSPRTVHSAVRSSSPLVLAVATSAALIALGSTLSASVPFASGLVTALLIVPSLVDLLDRRLPNRMVGGAASAGIGVAALTIASGGVIELQGAALGALAFGGPLLLMHLVSPRSMGFGDVKVAGVLGAAVGIVHPIYGLVALSIGCLIGAAIGLANRERTIAFGPALVGAAIVVLAIAASPIEVVSS